MLLFEAVCLYSSGASDRVGERALQYCSANGISLREWTSTAFHTAYMVHVVALLTVLNTRKCMDSDLEVWNRPSIVELQHLQVQLEQCEAQQSKCKWQ